MDILVIGAGAWGLPTAAELAERGHRVTLVDRHGPMNALSSSHGPTRIWRLADPDPGKAAMTRQSVAAMERLSSIAGEPVFLRRGIVWRDRADGPHGLDAFARTLTAEGIAFERLDAARVGERFPGLIPDDRGALWSPDAGPVLADVSLRAQLRRFERAGGTLRLGEVIGIRSDATSSGTRRVHLADGDSLAADVVVVAAGPGSSPLLEMLGHPVPLRPQLVQVVHVASPSRSTDDLPDLVDAPTAEWPMMFAMTTPGVGYKLGFEQPIRDAAAGDDDRTPDAARTASLARYARRVLGMTDATIVDAQVCTWTESPDSRFVIDAPEPGLVIACGDSGEGFKFSALMGLVLADLAEGSEPSIDLEPFRLDRFGHSGAAAWPAAGSA